VCERIWRQELIKQVLPKLARPVKPLPLYFSKVGMLEKDIFKKCIECENENENEKVELIII
jgi:hypothetical protein